EVNSIAQVGDELLGVVALDTTLNIVTVKRAVLDSPLTVHSNGDTIYFWDQALFNDPTEYVDGETINAKVLTITGGGQLSLASAPTDSIEMDARAIRPLPPGQFKINDQYFPMAISGDVTASWSERNRLQQTGGLPLGFYDNGVTPEAGTTYTVRAFNSSTDELLHETTGITTTSHVIPSADLAGAIDVLVTVHAVRDGYESYVPRSHTFEYSAALNVMQFADGYTPPAGDGVVMEFTGYPAGVPYLHFERLQDAGASQPQQIELSISNANPDGETYNLAIGQDYTLTLGGANFEYTPIPLAADHYLNTVLDDSPAYLFSLRPDDVDEFGSGTTVSGYINFGSVSGACGVVTAQGS